MAKVSVSAVWDRATEFLGDNIAPVIAIALPFVYLPQLVQTSLQPIASDPTSGGIVIFVSFVAILVGIWGQLQVMALALDPGRPAGDARAVAAVGLLRVIVVSILLSIATLMLFVPIIGALWGAGIDFEAVARASASGTAPPPPPGMTTSIGWFLVLYATAMALFLIWAGVRLFVVNTVILAEGKMLEAIARSFQITRGHTLALIGLMLLYGIVSFVAVLAAQTVFGSIFGLVLGGEGRITIATVMTAAVSAMVATAFALLLASFAAHFYLAVRARDVADAA